MYGDPGCGKSHIIQLIIKHLIETMENEGFIDSEDVCETDLVRTRWGYVVNGDQNHLVKFIILINHLKHCFTNWKTC